MQWLDTQKPFLHPSTGTQLRLPSGYRYHPGDDAQVETGRGLEEESAAKREASLIERFQAVKYVKEELNREM